MIVTAGNYEYFDTLQHTIYLVHQHYPDFELVIYDLGLTKRQHKLVRIAISLFRMRSKSTLTLWSIFAEKITASTPKIASKTAEELDFQ